MRATNRAHPYLQQQCNVPYNACTQSCTSFPLALHDIQIVSLTLSSATPSILRLSDTPETPEEVGLVVTSTNI